MKGAKLVRISISCDGCTAQIPPGAAVAMRDGSHLCPHCINMLRPMAGDVKWRGRRWKVKLQGETLIDYLGKDDLDTQEGA